MWLYWQLFLVGLRLLGRERQDLVLENVVLRQQLAIHERSGHRAKLEPADRRFWSVTAHGWVRWRSHVQIVQPATVVGGIAARGAAIGVGRAAAFSLVAHGSTLRPEH